MPGCKYSQLKSTIKGFSIGYGYSFQTLSEKYQKSYIFIVLDDFKLLERIRQCNHNTCILMDRCLSEIQLIGVMEKEPDKKKKRWINPLRDRTRVIPFVVPNKQEQMNALGSLAGEKWKIKKSLLAILDEFEPIKTPEPGDNLYQFEQQGQGYGLFASRSRNHIDKDREIIYIATFYSNITEETLKRIKKKAKAFFYGVKVKFHDFGKADLQKFDPMISENGQKYYDASRLNTYFAKHLPKNTYSVAILTNLLIYNGDNPQEGIHNKWVFGLGSIKDRTSIISFQEIIKHGYGCKRAQGVEDECQLNVVNHELCHTFAMRHCIFHRCLMNGSNHYEEAVSKFEHLCPICLRKLNLELQFDFADRYEALGDEKSLSMASKIRESLKINGK